MNLTQKLLLAGTILLTTPLITRAMRPGELPMAPQPEHELARIDAFALAFIAQNPRLQEIFRHGTAEQVTALKRALVEEYQRTEQRRPTHEKREYQERRDQHFQYDRKSTGHRTSHNKH
jgi:hypothetical protein